MLMVILAALLLGVSFLFAFCGRKLRRRWRRRGSLKAEKFKFRRFQVEELEKATKNCSAEVQCIDNVYKGTFKGESTLAIKRAHAELYQSIEEFKNGRGGRNLTWKQQVNIAIGAAKGTAHLHDGIKPSIIHRDIKPSWRRV